MARFIEIQSGSQVRMINVENIVSFAPNYGKFTPQTTIELDTDIFMKASSFSQMNLTEASLIDLL